MPDWMQAALNVAGSAFVLLGTVYVARKGAQSSKHAADRTAEVQEEANAVNGYTHLVADLRTDIDRLRKDHDSLAEKHVELKSHVRDLEIQRRRDRSLIRALYDLARRMRDSLRAAGLPVPESAVDLDEPLPS